ncbi:MAG: DUF4253 domain-containing protein [Pseudomonadota bacterium]
MTGRTDFDADKYRREALENFPFEIQKVHGRDALKEWEKLRLVKGFYPVVIGGDHELDLLLEPFSPLEDETRRSVEAILETAEKLQHPLSLKEYVNEQEAHAKKMLETLTRRDDEQVKDGLKKEPQPPVTSPEMTEQLSEKLGADVQAFALEEFIASDPIDDDYEPEMGRWPWLKPREAGLSVAYDVLSGKPLPSVNIVLIPTDDWTEAPAYLRWGNWNDNPPPEYHVAALRSWRDRYGAELVGLSHDVMNIRVVNKPGTRDEAVELAREHYAYCSDIVDQGTGTFAPLAASLKANKWWYFWWD